MSINPTTTDTKSSIIAITSTIPVCVPQAINVMRPVAAAIVKTVPASATTLLRPKVSAVVAKPPMMPLPNTPKASYTFQMGFGRGSPNAPSVSSTFLTTRPLSTGAKPSAVGLTPTVHHRIQLPIGSANSSRFIQQSNKSISIPVAISNTTTARIASHIHMTATTPTTPSRSNSAASICSHQKCQGESRCQYQSAIDSTTMQMSPTVRAVVSPSPTKNSGNNGPSPRPTILRKRHVITPLKEDTRSASDVTSIQAARKLVLDEAKDLNHDNGSNHSQSTSTSSGAGMSINPVATVVERPGTANTPAGTPGADESASPRKRARKQQFNAEDQSSTRLYITTPVSEQASHCIVPPACSASPTVFQAPTIPAIQWRAAVKPSPVSTATETHLPQSTQSEDETESCNSEQTPSTTSQAQATSTAVMNSAMKQPTEPNSDRMTPISGMGRPHQFKPPPTEVKRDPLIEYRKRPRLLADYLPSWSPRAGHYYTMPKQKSKCTKGPVSSMSKLANDQMTWKRVNDVKMSRFQHQLMSIRDREIENKKTVSDLKAFFKNHLHPNDAKKRMIMTVDEANFKYEREMVENQQGVLVERCARLEQRHKNLETDIEHISKSLQRIVDKHKIQIVRKLNRFTSKRAGKAPVQLAKEVENAARQSD